MFKSSSRLSCSLWYFITAICAACAIVWQQYTMNNAAENLTSKIRQLSFKAILRHDIEWFDEEANSVRMAPSSGKLADPADRCTHL